jgi:hypothetical protein
VTNPRVFISHAREDKEKFVRDFATKLRERGIDAWFDEWEIGPGDSIVDKIFEEGIGHADAVIVVVSAVSVQKPWVRVEMNTSVIKRVEGKIKLIPVIIDESPAPEALTNLLHVRVKDVNNYGTELDRIVGALYGTLKKPALGQAPEYSKSSPIPAAGLHNADQHVLTTACKLSLAEDSDVLIPSDVVSHVEGLGLSEKQVADSIRILAEEGLLAISGSLGTYVSHFRISPRGFELFCRDQLEGYDSIVQAVAGEILNEGTYNSLLIAEALSQPRIVVNHIMSEFAAQGFCKKSGEIGTHVSVYDISPRFRRTFEG